VIFSRSLDDLPDDNDIGNYNDADKWSKNFDESPHRPAVVTPAPGESILLLSPSCSI